MRITVVTCLSILKENFWFLFFTAIFVMTAAVLGHHYNQSEIVKFSLYSQSLFKAFQYSIPIMVVVYLIYVTFIADTTTLIGKFVHDFNTHILNVRNLASILIIVLAFPYVLSSLTIMKTLLPYITNYHLDHFLMNLDKALHFGVAPWELMQPFLGYPYVTFGLNIVYNFWFFMQFFVVIWQILSLSRPRLRMQFFISYVLAWMVLGSLLAILLASAGPCYYPQITGLTDPYSPLFEYLHHVDNLLKTHDWSLWALHTQDYLWDNYVESTVALGSGISAMPSLHISVAVLLALVGWRTNRGIGIFLTAHAFLIFIGSVHLGWHYAVDGYVSVIVTLLIWRFSGYLAKNLPERRESTKTHATNTSIVLV